MPERTRIAERYTRGFAAAVVAVVTLILAANAGPARAGEQHPPRPTGHAARLAAAHPLPAGTKPMT